MRFLAALLVALPVFGEGLNFQVSAVSHLDRGLPFRVHVSLFNTSETEARDVVIRISAEGITGWRDLPPFCSEEGLTAVCTVASIPPRTQPLAYINFQLTAVAAENPPGDRISISGVVSDSTGKSASDTSESAMYPTFDVTNTAGSGPGSLYDALAGARADGCSFRCKIRFRIPPGPGRWVTIRPTQPLPPLVRVILDGNTQTAAFGDTNPDGPEIEINGELAGRSVTGLAIETGLIANVTVNGFDGPGIHVSGGAEIDDNYVGCNPMANKIVPNERGIVLDAGTARPFIENNIISGNRRAGIYAWSASNPIIAFNRVEWNGASGMFMGPQLDGAYIYVNAVAHNAHAGIAITGGVREVEAWSNSFYANGGLGIDYQLDGVSRAVDGTSAKVEYPEITSAWYDPATDTTIVEGFQRAKHDGFTTRSVSLYANDAPDPSGFGEGQYPLGTHGFADFRAPDDPRFRITLRGKPPGRWISGTVTVSWHYYWLRGPRGEGNSQGLRATSSEFGPTVEIQGW